MKLSDKKLLFIDIGGIFTEVAVRLAKDFGEVKYFSSWVEAFPTHVKKIIGKGMEGLERVDYFEDYKEWADLIVVPDTYCCGLVDDLKRNGYPVAGVGEAEWLENDRWEARQLQGQIGLPKQKTWKIEGLSKLKDILKKTTDKVIKLNQTRGDIETFKHDDWFLTEPKLDHIKKEMGRYAEEVTFIMEENIEGIEPGIDAVIYNGKVVSPTIVGFEIKGAGYLGKVYDYEDVPKPLKDVNDKLEKTLKDLDYNFWFSSEVIIDKTNTGYLIDPCCRLASPTVNAIQQEWIENYSEIYWAMGHDEKVIPKYKAKYGGGAALYSEWTQQNEWLPVEFDKKDRQWIKFREARCTDGKFEVAPKASTVCSIVAIGNSPEEVIELIQKRAESVKAYMLDKSSIDFTELQEALKKAKKFGFNF